MGLLSFIYSVLGYNLCATLFIAYLMFDYVLGALATFGARYVMESKSGGAYDFYIRWIRVDYGWTELTLTIGPITFKNPKKFKMTPFLIKIDRISCQIQVGKKGVKQKTPAAPASNNPDWGKTITLTPITDLEEDVRIQVYDRRIFAEDDQLGKTLKIPLRELIDNAAVEKWYDIEPTDDKPLKEGEKSAQVKLSLELHGVKATGDSGEVAANQD